MFTVALLRIFLQSGIFLTSFPGTREFFETYGEVCVISNVTLLFFGCFL